MQGNDARMAGLLAGTAAGDSLGLRWEGLAPGRVRALARGRDVLRGLLPGGWQVVSDDTEHAVLAAEALLAAPLDERAFLRALAWRLRMWSAALPPGVGLATLKACLKLWLGFHPARSGVRSAGNGPLMRAPVIGAFHAGRPDLAVAFASASARITHRDDRAVAAAVILALLAGAIVRGEAPSDRRGRALLLASVLGAVPTPTQHRAEWERMVTGLVAASTDVGSLADYAAGTLGCARGVSGYVLHTLPAAALAWVIHGPNLADAIRDCILVGGDTDSVAAVAGALCGADLGREDTALVGRIRDLPVGVPHLRGTAAALAAAAATGMPQPRMARPRLVALPRNLAVFGIALCHAFRRLAPPYDPSPRAVC